MLKRRIISGAMALLCAASMVTLQSCKSSKTLTWYVIGDTPKDLDEVLEQVNKIVEPEIGMTLEMKFIDTASFKEKMALKMSKQEDYDLAFTGYCNNYQSAVQNNSLYDITDLAKEVGLTDPKVIPESFIEAAKVDGKLYGIPNVQVVSNPACLMLDKSLYEKMNGIDLEAIQEIAIKPEKSEADLEQLDSMLQALFAECKRLEPTKTPYNPSYEPFTQATYEQVVGCAFVKKDGSDNTIYNIDETPEAKYQIKAMRDWYKKGYIRSDIAAAGGPASTDEDQKQCCVRGGTWKPGQDGTIKDRFGDEPVYIMLESPYIKRDGPLATMISVGANSKHPKEAVEFIKLINTNKDLYNLVIWGIEGKHYTLNDEGKVVQKKDSGYATIGTAMGWAFGNQFNAILAEDQDDDSWTATEQMNEEAIISPMMGFVPNTESIANEITNANNISDTFSARRKYGTADAGEYEADYEKQMKSAGCDKIVSEMQKQYDAFLKNKN